MKVFGLVGWSGSGKTTLIAALVPDLRRRGLTVSTIKHTHHNVDLDRHAKDSFRHRQAGAVDVVLLSASRWALMHELRGATEPTVDDLLTHMTPVDLILVEGFKALGHAKIEVHRPALGKPLLSRTDPTIVAVASDEPVEGVGVPLLTLDDVGAIGDFIVTRCGLSPPR